MSNIYAALIKEPADLTALILSLALNQCYRITLHWFEVFCWRWLMLFANQSYIVGIGLDKREKHIDVYGFILGGAVFY